MVGNSFGRIFKVTTCGESYAGGFRKNLDIPKELFGGLMTIVDGVPPGIKLTAEFVQNELDKRKPGASKLDTPRKERDKVYIFSGVMEDDLTTGAPVGMIIPNGVIEDEHLNKHKSYKELIRPGQAGYTFFKMSMNIDKINAENINFFTLPGRPVQQELSYYILDKVETMKLIDDYFVVETIEIKEPIEDTDEELNEELN
jgi:hypothetical protein